MVCPYSYGNDYQRQIHQAQQGRDLLATTTIAGSGASSYSLSDRSYSSNSQDTVSDRSYGSTAHLLAYEARLRPDHQPHHLSSVPAKQYRTYGSESRDRVSRSMRSEGQAQSVSLRPSYSRTSASQPAVISNSRVPMKFPLLKSQSLQYDVKADGSGALHEENESSSLERFMKAHEVTGGGPNVGPRPGGSGRQRWTREKWLLLFSVVTVSPKRLSQRTSI